MKQTKLIVTLFFVGLFFLSSITAYGQDEDFLVDTGFRLDTDAFNFPNYGDEVCSETACQISQGLTPDTLRRMFGDVVCRSIDEEGECKLIRTAQAWMDKINSAADDGHCEGMAVLSALFYADIIDPADFGSPVVHDLDILDNPALQEEIAYWFATQWDDEYVTIENDPLTQLQTIISAYEEDPDTLIPIGIYQRDGSGGHAITSYAIEDKGDGIYWLMVYDNNYPDEERYITIDANANSWYYSGASNPDEEEDVYDGEGDENPFELCPLESRLKEQYICSFCANLDATELEEVDNYNTITVERDVNILIHDENGLQAGFDWENDTAYDEIEGVEILRNTSNTIVNLPNDLSYDMWINSPDEAYYAVNDVTIYSPGTMIFIKDLLESEDYPNLSYMKPTVIEGFDDAYEFFIPQSYAGILPKTSIVISTEDADFEMELDVYSDDETYDDIKAVMMVGHNYEDGLIILWISGPDDETTSDLQGATFSVYGDLWFESEDYDDSLSLDEDSKFTIETDDILVLDYKNWIENGELAWYLNELPE